MPPTTYRAAIIGLSGIGIRRPRDPAGQPLYWQMPRSHAGAYHQHPRTEVVAACDILPAALQNFQREWGNVWPDARLYTDYHEMLEKEHLDLVSIVTPDNLHAEPCLAAIQAGAKAVLCEKPFATTLADADRMIAAAEAKGVLLSVDHTRRWDAKYHKAREIVRSGALGRLRAVHGSSHHPRAMLFRDGTHTLDMICFFAEADPQWIMAELEEGFDHFTEYRADGGRDSATDPAASAYIHFVNGVRAYFSSIKTKANRYQLELVCDEGLVEVSDVGVNVVTNVTPTEWSISARFADEYLAEYQLGALEEVLRALEHGGELICSGREARKTVEIALAILKSHQLGNQRVNLPLA